jgi:hypothetical protein
MYIQVHHYDYEASIEDVSRQSQHVYAPRVTAEPLLAQRLIALFLIVKEHATCLRRSPARMAYRRGADRDRTDNLLVANQALSQLSYSPVASRIATPETIAGTQT